MTQEAPWAVEDGEVDREVAFDEGELGGAVVSGVRGADGVDVVPAAGVGEVAREASVPEPPHAVTVRPTHASRPTAVMLREGMGRR